MRQRYQVFTRRDDVAPAFSAPWYWIASLYSTFFCGSGDYCRIMDARRNEPVMEWRRATRDGRSDRLPTRTLTLRLDSGYWPRSYPVVARARAWIIGALLRVPMRFGRVVILVGPCRSGKSFILERATPNRIIDKSALLRHSYPVAPPAFDLNDVPPTAFSIDETMAFDADSLRAGLQSLRGRGFAITFQAASHIDRMGLTDELAKKHRCIVLKLGRN
jgi:hypothetical protein